MNNAGLVQQAEAIATDLEVDRAVFELNYIGTISLTKAVLPHMIERGDGTIVTVSSLAGRKGELHCTTLDSILIGTSPLWECGFLLLVFF